MIVIFLKAWAKGQIGFNADLLLTIWSLLAHIWMFVSGSQNDCFVRWSKSVVCCVSVIGPCVNVKVVSVRIAGECEWVSRDTIGHDHHDPDNHTHLHRKQDNGSLEQWQSLFIIIIIIIVIIFLLWINRQSCVLPTVTLHYDILGMHYIAKIYKYIVMYSRHFQKTPCVAQTSHSYETRDWTWASSTAVWRHRPDSIP